jgi:hypothetical protein
VGKGRLGSKSSRPIGVVAHTVHRVVGVGSMKLLQNIGTNISSVSGHTNSKNNYCSFFFAYENVYQFTCAKQKVPD